MPKSTPVIFQRTLLAAAIVSLSACSSMPKVPELGAVGDGVARAGKATADLSRKTWNTTTYLLGFSDSKDGESASPSDEQLLVADSEDVNQVLPLANAPVIETPVIPTAIADRPVLVQQATASTAQSQPLPDADVASVDNTLQAQEDLIHEVSSNETLWDIAKLTTGDATNWHVIADVNDLTQNATVFPGQQLVIPANLVQPDFDQPVVSAASDKPEIAIDTQNLTAGLTAELPDVSLPQLEIPAPSDELVSGSDQASTQQQVTDTAAQLASVSEDASAFDLNVGETLWDFAKRTTGDATNWKAIASHNNFTEKQAVTVRPGQTIFVPLSLVRKEPDTTATAPASTLETPAEQVAVAATDTLPQPLPAAASVTTDDASITDQTTLASALPASTALPEQTGETTGALNAEASILDESQPMTIVEATYKSDDSLDPSKVEDVAIEMVENENIPAQIMVSGTYYPKAVYNDADFSSSLLMRVSPGTQLQVSRAMGTWFEVETDKGVGYVHQRDIK